MNKNSVYSNVGVMIKKGLIEKSGEGYVTTEQGDAILMQAAEMWKAAQPKDETPAPVEKKKGTRKARTITTQMTENVELVQRLLCTLGIEHKDAVINRQNYEITLSKRHIDGYRKFEILNRGIFRVVGYRVTDEKIEMFKALGCEIKQGPANCYIDIDANEENIIKIMDCVEAAN